MSVEVETTEGIERAAEQHRRADVFRSAHALVTSLKWDETVGVYDVLQVARFLEERD
ncbi:hypothetical protein [Streptomyces sp. NRRL F-5630]|uniref:hypothetical protein n=1 Tax=Streptomyces sp. NRRL F-5630 TaxID=1463864 RepID=UPI000B273BE8|nr:hypothetical protein [Streptomyces sp. NRRL F-5630]